MAITLAPTQSDIMAALRTFLLSILPAGTDVVQTQINRVPEPRGSDFVLMTPIRRTRLETNVDSYADVAFVGSIAGTTLTVTEVELGTIQIGAVLFGSNIVTGSAISGFLTGSGGVGTYSVTPAQNAASTVMACGAEAFLQPITLTVQLDVHGPASPDNAQVISTLFRDDYATTAFLGINPAVIPLYADDPREMPFVNDQNQYEWRWVITAELQANQAVAAPLQFMDVATVGIKEVEAFYPIE